MKIYVLFGCNNEDYEDYWYGLMEDHVYSNPIIAQEICFKLNNPIITLPTMQEWENCNWVCTW